MKNSDAGIGLALAAIGAFVYFVVVPAQIPERSIDGFGVSTFPKLLLGLIIFLSLFLAVKSVVTGAGVTMSKMLEGWRADLLMLLPIPASYLIIRYLGLPAFAAIITPACMLAMGERRWWRIVIVALCLAITTRVIVVNVLSRQPLGIW